MIQRRQVIMGLVGSAGLLTGRKVLAHTKRRSVIPASGVNSLLYDTIIRTIPAQAKPAYLGSYIDPTYGTTITRISGDPGATIPTVGGQWSQIVKHHYSGDQAWNADQTLMFLTNSDGTIGTSGGLFIDGNTYAPLFGGFQRGGIPSGGNVRWHPTDPALMYYASGSVFGIWNIQTGAKTVLHTFTGYTSLEIGSGNGVLSLDGNWIALNGVLGTTLVNFAYNITTDTKYPDIVGDFGYISISPLGDYVVCGASTGGTTIYRLDGSIKTVFSEIEVPSHFDMCVSGSNGNEVAVGTRKNDPGLHGRMIKRRLDTGGQTDLATGGWVSHTSCRATHLDPSWLGYQMAFGSYEYTSSPSYQLYNGEIVAARVDGNLRVYRLCHHHGLRIDYNDEVHGSASPDGLRVVFVSDWSDPSGRPAQTYICDLR